MAGRMLVGEMCLADHFSSGPGAGLDTERWTFLESGTVSRARRRLM